MNAGGVAAYTESKSRPATWLYPHPTNRVLILRMLPSALTRTSNTHRDFMTCLSVGRGTQYHASFDSFPRISSSIFSLSMGHHCEAIAWSTVLMSPIPVDSAAACACAVGPVTVTSIVCAPSMRGDRRLPPLSGRSSAKASSFMSATTFA